MVGNNETVRTIRISGRSDGLDKLADTLKRVEGHYQSIGDASASAAAVTEQAVRKQVSASEAWNREVSKAYGNPQAEAAFVKGLDLSRRAFDQGIISAARYAQEIDRLKRTFQAAGAPSGPAAPSFMPAVSAKDAAAAFQAEFDRLELIATQRAGSIAENWTRELNERLVAGTAKSARDAAAVFSEALDPLDAAAAMKAQWVADEFTRSLNERLISGTGKSARDAAAAFSAALDPIDDIARMKGAQAGAEFQRALNERMGISGRPTKSAADSGKFFQDLDRLNAEIDPSAANVQRLAERMETYNELLQSGHWDATMFAKAQAYANNQFELTQRSIDGTNVAMGKYAKGTGLARHELVNLSRQAQDVFVSLAAGQAPLTVLIQQGTQIADVFSTSKGSIGAFFIQITTGAARFATSLAGVATGTVALTAGAMAAAYQYSESQREVERSLNGVGRASGLTVDGINRIAESSAAASKISVSSAREIAAAFAGTGKIAPGMTGDLVGLTKNYAAQTGQDRATAAQELGKAFADPLKGADALNEKLGNLDARTRSYIRTLLEQNDRSGAQKVLLDSVSQAVKGAADNVSGYAKAWNAVARAASDAWDAIGSAGTPASIESRLAIAQRSLAAQREARARSGIWSGVTQSDMDQNAAAVDDLGEQARRRGALQASRASQAAAADQSLRVQGLIENVTPQIQELEKFRSALADLESYLNRPLGTMDAKGITEAQEAADRYRNALESSITPLQRIERENAVGLRSINAKTRAEQETVEILRLQLDLAGKLMTSAEREAKIAGEIAKSRAQRVEGILGRTDADGEALRKTRDELETIQLMLAGAIGTLRIEDVDRSKDAVDKLTTSIETNLTSFQKRERAGQIAIAAINARTVAERAAVEMARESLNLAGSEIIAAERKLAIQQKLNEAQAQANRGMQDALRQARDSASLAGLLPYQRALKQIEIDTRNRQEQFGTSAASAPAAANSNIPTVGADAIPATAGALRGLDAAFAANLQKLMQEFPGLGITSGFRTTEQQARLYAEKGPGWAAPPGRSNHERGTAADLNYNGKSTLPDEVYKRAGELGIAFPLKDRANKPEPWHAEPAGARAGGGLGGSNAGMDRQIESLKRYELNVEAIAGPLRDANMALDAQIRLVDAQAKTMLTPASASPPSPAPT